MANLHTHWTMCCNSNGVPSVSLCLSRPYRSIKQLKIKQSIIFLHLAKEFMAPYKLELLDRTEFSHGTHLNCPHSRPSLTFHSLFNLLHNFSKSILCIPILTWLKFKSHHKHYSNIIKHHNHQIETQLWKRQKAITWEHPMSSEKPTTEQTPPHH